MINRCTAIIKLLKKAKERVCDSGSFLFAAISIHILTITHVEIAGNNEFQSGW